VPVSPQDFNLWSSLTGNPYPQTAQERMQLAPHVHQFVQNIGRQGGYAPQPQPSGLRRAVDAIGKTALAAGILTGATMLATHHLGKSGVGSEEGLREAHKEAGDTMQPTSVAAESHISTQTPFETPAQDIIAQEVPAPALAADEPASYKAQEAAAFRKAQVHKLRQGQMGVQSGEMIGHTDPGAVEAFRQTPGYHAAVPQVIQNSGDVTPPTTADRYGQDVIPTEIRVRQVAKGAAPGSEARESLRTKPVTETEHLATSQTSAPSVQALAAPGPSHQEVRELDDILTKAHGWTHSRVEREMMRNDILSKKYGTAPTATGTTAEQSEAAYAPSGHVVQTAAQPAPKEFLRQGVEKMKNIAQLRQSGYDPEQGFGAAFAPGTEQMGPSHHDLLAEQLQREGGRQAGQAEIYKRLQAQRIPYAPQPQAMMAVHGQGFFHPSAHGLL